jgi:hypothetical protein
MILLIGKDDCRYCDEIKQILNEKHIAYTYSDQKRINSEMLNFFRTKQKFYPYMIDIKEFETFEQMKFNIQ